MLILQDIKSHYKVLKKPRENSFCLVTCCVSLLFCLCSVGVFTVSVNASNAVSHEISSETIFVTTTFCKPPAISFLGLNNIKVSVWLYVWLITRGSYASCI